jgi:uncharacterized membrane protein YcaP (DUF421 family)
VQPERAVTLLFDSWHQLGAVAARGTITYFAVVVALRLVGEQALAQMSAYDLICTIALGSFVASVTFAQDISVLDGLAAIIAVLALQELLRWLQFRFRKVRRFVREEPCVVVWEGRILEDRLSRFKISREEVRAAIRRGGLASLQEAQAVVLENDGNWSVIARREQSDLSAFDGLQRP